MKPRTDSREVVCSVVCLTYNQQAYIAKALDGFLMQQTAFPIEIIVHDDASTDNTAAVVRQYEAQYPHLFVCKYQTENQYSKQGHTICNDVVRNESRGKYIALCEGDDYWIDARKLEKQVAFMEANPQCSMSFHAARIDYADGNTPPRVHRYPGRKMFEPGEVIMGGGGFYPTCTAMFKREVIVDNPTFFVSSPVGDSILALSAITKGSVGYIDEIMAVYNSVVPGSWTQRFNNRSLNQKLDFYRQLAVVRAEFDRFTGYKYSKWIRKRGSRNAMLALMGNACKPGCYKQYWRIRGSMNFQDQFLFHLGYACLHLRTWVR